ncbi:MAG: MOSC domain-containing protein [Deltaproteobacteria bacterium]|nr:MOSC domain-containing protein [Deltaproteobacteria bacterium]
MDDASQPSKAQLLDEVPTSFDTTKLRFDGLRGDASRHLTRAELEAGIAALPPAPKDEGTVDLLVARTPEFGRILHEKALLTVEGGMPQDRFAEQTKYGLDHQLATTRTDFARLIANGQPLELHGDNLFLSLDLSDANLPAGSRIRLGEALVEVTPTAHNGCKKWVQRFGLAAMRLNMSAAYRPRHLRGIYLRVIEAGECRVGDAALVVNRGTAVVAAE